MAVKKRVGAVDFWRGVVLIGIVFEHIPGNILENFTQRNVGFSDCSEVFVFLAGVSTALVYYKKILQDDTIGVIKRCFNRAFRIYTIHIGLTVCGIFIFAIAYTLNALPDLVQEGGRFMIFNKPLHGFLNVLLLSHQVSYFNILPIYVVMMAWSPVVLATARKSVWLALGMSIAIYALSRIVGPFVTIWPHADPYTWFFNPFAWQLVFTIGMIAGIKWSQAGVPFSPVLLALSVVIVAVSAFLVLDGFSLVPGVREQAFQQLDLLKRDLGIVRLLHFLALAYIVSQMRFFGTLARTRFGEEFQRIGRHSLPIFAFGSLLCCIAQAILLLANARFADNVDVFGMILTLISCGILVLIARYLDWVKQRDMLKRSVPAREANPARTIALPGQETFAG